jgi:hypothetical protein
MGTFTLLGSLLLAALGVTAAAFAVNGYLGEQLQDRFFWSAPTGQPTGQPSLPAPGGRAAASMPPPVTMPATVRLAMRSRARFVLLEPPIGAAAAPRVVAAAVKSKAKVRAKAPAMQRPPARKAAVWPWNLIN